MEEKLEFSKDKVSSLLAVMYVPCCFSVKKEKDGKIRAVPIGEYAGFISEADANNFLKEIEQEFTKHNVVNFSDIKKCAQLSKDTIEIAKRMQKKGLGVLLRTFGASDLQRLDARTMEDFSKVSWYATLGRKGNKIGCLEIQSDDNMVWFDLPGTSLRIKAGIGVLRDLEAYYGEKFEFSLGSSKTIAHISVDNHRRANAKD